MFSILFYFTILAIAAVLEYCRLEEVTSSHTAQLVRHPSWTRRGQLPEEEVRLHDETTLHDILNNQVSQMTALLGVLIILSIFACIRVLYFRWLSEAWRKPFNSDNSRGFTSK